MIVKVEGFDRRYEVTLIATVELNHPPARHEIASLITDIIDDAYGRGSDEDGYTLIADETHLISLAEED